MQKGTAQIKVTEKAFAGATVGQALQNPLGRLHRALGASWRADVLCCMGIAVVHRSTRLNAVRRPREHETNSSGSPTDEPRFQLKIARQNPETRKLLSCSFSILHPHLVNCVFSTLVAHPRAAHPHHARWQLGIPTSHAHLEPSCLCQQAYHGQEQLRLYSLAGEASVSSSSLVAVPARTSALKVLLIPHRPSLPRLAPSRQTLPPDGS